MTKKNVKKIVKKKGYTVCNLLTDSLNENLISDYENSTRVENWCSFKNALKGQGNHTV